MSTSKDKTFPEKFKNFFKTLKGGGKSAYILKLFFNYLHIFNVEHFCLLYSTTKGQR
jgi:hypothetical protein